MIRNLVAALALLVVATPQAANAQINPNDLLPVEEAFALDATISGSELELEWTIAEGYYLYRHAFEFESLDDEVEFGAPAIPDGETTVDDFFGETETYRGRVAVRIPVEHAGSGASLQARIGFQGCADVGVCYPPHHQTVALELPADVSSPTEAPASSGQLFDSSPAISASGGLDGLLGNTTAQQALPPERAFQVEAIADGPGSILVRATPASGYYLYRESFSFAIDDEQVAVASAQLPEGELTTDEYFGRTRVYFDQVEIPVLVERSSSQAREVDLEVNFQGCLDGGICYPPMTRQLGVKLPEADESDLTEPGDAGAAGSESAADGEAAGKAADTAAGDKNIVQSGTLPPASEQDRLAAALGGSPLLAMGLFLLAGILLAFTPCVFPMVPILSGLIAGEGDRMTGGRAFRLSLVYVLAMAVVYTLFGVVAGLFGHNLQAVFQHPVILVSFAALFVALSFSMFGFYELQLPSSIQTRLNELSSRAEGGTLMGAAIMGALSALVVGPCVAPALMGALIYIGQTGDAILGGLALFAMAMGMGIPLVIWGTSAGKLLPRSGAWMEAVKAVFGVGLLALAIWMLERVLPAAVGMLLWGALAIGSGVWLGALARLPADVGGWRKLWQSLGFMLLLFGAIQFVGALSGGHDWMRPLHHLAGGGSGAASQPAPEFHRVENLEQLQAAVAAADTPVFLDFYADWCVDCVRMERRTFPDPQVAGRLGNFTLLKADITAYNDDHKAMLTHFGLIGPPAYLFFKDGEELEAFRMFGFMPPSDFAQLLDTVAP